MDVRNCRICGNIFNYVVGPVMCPACRQKLEEKFQEVKNYIRENKGVKIPEVAKACDVDANQIRQWLRENRLELSAESADGLLCESCGKPIRSGRFCDKCMLNMTKGFQDIVKSGKQTAQRPLTREEDGAKMRFLK